MDQAMRSSDQAAPLLSILYHAQKAGEAYVQYCDDAEHAGDKELLQFLRDLQQQDRLRTERARALLGRRLALAQTQSDRLDEALIESFPASDPPAHG